jgi:hypothetical protein
VSTLALIAHQVRYRADPFHLMFQSSNDHMPLQILAVPRNLGMGRAVVIALVVYVRTGVVGDIAVRSSIVVCLSVTVSWTQD